jgi:hypothetical protein
MAMPSAFAEACVMTCTLQVLVPKKLEKAAKMLTLPFL